MELLLDAGDYEKLIYQIEFTTHPSDSQLLYKAKALRLLGKNKEALELLNSLDVSSDLIISIQSLRERGHILLELGFYDTAENMINEAFEILSIIGASQIEMENIKGNLLHTSGNLLSHKGDFQNALNYWEESLEIKSKQEKIIDQANLYNNIAIYHFIVEEYDKALEFFFDAFELIKPYAIKKTMTGILLNIGDTYFNAGDIDKALQYAHQSLVMTENTALDYIKSNCFLSLIQYNLVLNDVSQVGLYYGKLLKMTLKIDSAYINLFENYAKALILKSSDLEDDKQKAKQHFQQILEQSTFDFQLYYNVVLNMTDILLNEIYSTGDRIKLKTLTSLIDELYEDAQTKQLFHYAIDALALKSKIVTLNDCISESEFLLEQALMFAEDNQFVALKKKIVNEQLKLKEKIGKYEDYANKYFSIQERMDLCDIQTYVRSELNLN